MRSVDDSTQLIGETGHHKMHPSYATGVIWSNRRHKVAWEWTLVQEIWHDGFTYSELCNISISLCVCVCVCDTTFRQLNLFWDNADTTSSHQTSEPKSSTLGAMGIWLYLQSLQSTKTLFFLIFNNKIQAYVSKASPCALYVIQVWWSQYSITQK